MLREHDLVGDGASPLSPPPPPLAIPRLGGMRDEMQSGYYGEPFTAPRVRRDVATREGAKLSITDTITMLRARRPLHQRDSAPRMTIAGTDDEHCQDIGDDDWCSGTAGQSATSNRRDGRVLPHPSLPHTEENSERVPGLLTLAGSITLPKPRVRRPMMGRPLPTARDSVWDTGSMCSLEGTSFKNRGTRRSDCDETEQCCTGPECAVRPSPQPWASDDGSMKLPLHSWRGNDVHGSQFHLFQSTDPLQSTRDRPVPPARFSQLLAQDISNGTSSPEFAFRQPRHHHLESTSPNTRRPRSEHGQGYGDSDFSPVNELALRRQPHRSQKRRHSSENDPDDDEDNDDERPSSNVPELVIDGMTPEQIRQAKKDRRKEQCRINQANYRKRKRAVERQTDHAIQQLQDEIERLQVQRDTSLRRAQDAKDSARNSRDPMNMVQEVLLRLSTPQEESRQARAPLRQVDAIVGLGCEEFVSADELLAQWKYHRSVFDVFEFRLRSVRSEQLGDSLVLTAEATLRCSIVARSHKRHEKFREEDDQAIAVCPVLQRYMFDTREGALAKIISEVDWVAGLRSHSTSLVALAMRLVT